MCRGNEVIVRTFPTYNSDPKGKNYGLYCKYQLIKFKPWQTHPHNAWNNLPECDETFISIYKHFLSTNYAKQHIATITEELHRAEQYEALQYSHLQMTQKAHRNKVRGSGCSYVNYRVYANRTQAKKIIFCA